jgi:N-methylhydantoinase A
MAARHNGARYRIGIDTGGTFTDVVAVEERSGSIFTTKVPSTPQDPSAGLVASVRRIMAEVGIRSSQVTGLFHGTTVTTNAVLTRRFEGLGLVVTQGFRHLLEIARQSVPDGYGNSFFWVKPDRIVPLHMVKEVPERCDFRGKVLRRVDRGAAAEVARWFKARGVQAVGVCLLHSYANGTHERAVRQIFRQKYPECEVSISSEVMPEYREYERAITTCMDAALKPHLKAYVRHAAARMGRLLPRAPFLVMKSNGGVVGARDSVRRPITTLLSGPAAGVLAGVFLAERCGYPNVITLDAGGTSTDVSVIEGGQARRTTQTVIEHFPVKVPMLDIVTVGTGGGSIAWVSAEGRLKVGPQSAGADPGPMCYGRGGQQPTLTDANLVLGRIPPALLGGELKLDPELAAEGIGRLAARLGLSPMQAALGVTEIAAWNQAHGIRRMTVQRGKDPRQYALVAFGGAGPLLAGLIADVLGIETILVPPSPGTTSAFGLQVVDLKHDYVRTLVQREDVLDVPAIARAFAALQAEGARDLARDGVAPARRLFLRSVDMRYLGEGQEMEIQVPAGPITAASLHRAIERFHTAYFDLFRYSYRDNTPVELVNFRVAAIGRVPRPTLPRIAGSGGSPRAASQGTRRVVFKGQGPVPCGIYARAALRAGNRIAGPAIIEDFGSTTLLLPGQHARVDPYGTLVITRGKGN